MRTRGSQSIDISSCDWGWGCTIKLRFHALRYELNARVIPKFQRLKSEELPLFSIDWLRKLWIVCYPNKFTGIIRGLWKNLYQSFVPKNKNIQVTGYELKLPTFALLITLSALTEPDCLITLLKYFKLFWIATIHNGLLLLKIQLIS